MASAYSMVIRGGTILDGTGGDPVEADLAIAGGRIAALGAGLPRGAEEIDARGLLVTPGFIDPHTHYDAQATWSARMTPSSWNGVTTAMMGNCGVGFAPCKPDDRATLIKLMEGVEDIPDPVLTEGLPWTWQSFEDYLDTLDTHHYDLDIAAQVPHSAVRVYTMGERALAREPASAADAQAMAALAAAGVRAGALGFSTSRTRNHKTLDGRLIPTLEAEAAELTAIAQGFAALGTGWFQVISDFDDMEAEFAMLRGVVERSGRPMAITILQRDSKPEEWRAVLARIVEANEAGVPMIGQVLTRATGILLGLELSYNPFSGRASWEAIAPLPRAEKLRALRDPAVRARIMGETAEGDMALLKRITQWDRLFPLGDPPDYEPPLDASIAAQAAREARAPEEVAYDHLLADEGQAILYRPVSNYSYGDLETVKDMLAHPKTLVSLGDGGAHVGMLCDASGMTYMLTHWTRDRARRTPAGTVFPLPWAIRRMTRDNAEALGLRDRGVLAPGYKADINVIDYDRLTVRRPRIVHDLPKGGKRLIQEADGYVATLVAGEPVYREGTETGALPGRLLRGPRKAVAPDR